MQHLRSTRSFQSSPMPKASSSGESDRGRRVGRHRKTQCSWRRDQSSGRQAKRQTSRTKPCTTGPSARKSLSTSVRPCAELGPRSPVSSGYQRTPRDPETGDFNGQKQKNIPRLTAGIGMLNSSGPFVGLLAQLVEQRTFNPQQWAPPQGFLNRFGAKRSQQRPRSATE